MKFGSEALEFYPLSGDWRGCAGIVCGRFTLYGRYAEDWGPAIWSDMLGI
ncbi:MAG TPA: hypothetical protein VKN62_10680 [Pelovirga sp.]|nr:hypothetical protein [Pelovirga sp.]